MNAQVEKFSDELDRLIDRCRHEYDLSYAEAVGVLQMVIHNLCEEAKEQAEEADPE